MPETASSAPLTLYRKHRPAAFDELVGQPAVVQGLTSAVKSSRVAHAYLFSGPRGTGKTSAARILAKCLDCLTNGPRPDPCGICEACTSIAAGTAFDVVEIDAASNRGINEIRELRDRVQFAPSQFRKKVYIIDEVHMLTSEAFNALLKTLEEPPEYVVFVLATTELHRVPATILSRCQRYEFRRMTPPVIAKRLEEVAKREKIALDDAAARRIAHLADGALRDALVLLEQARGFAGGKTIDAKVLDAAFGESHREIVERLVDAVIASDAGAALQAVADSGAMGVDAAWLSKELLRWFRLALLARTSREVLDMEAPPDEAEAIATRAAALGRAKIMASLRVLSDCVAQRWSTQPRIDLELALTRIIVPADELTMQGLSDRLRALEERSGSTNAPSGGAPAPAKPAQAPAATPAPVARKTGKSVASPASAPVPDISPSPVVNAAGSLTPTKLRAMWHLVMTAVRERSNTVFAYLQHATVTDATDQTVTLSVTKKHFLESLSDAGTSALIAGAIEDVSGIRPRIAFELGSAPARQAAAVRDDNSGFALAESVLGTELL
ncbi:MAG TPA: DNA polymerase III subunit gamma/tau [Candidatus Eremiobacteraceae bacterium]|nr:DNA polymerase III subunit gamma/tau [Candidatus Eremiobacteraceae bacterium]